MAAQAGGPISATDYQRWKCKAVQNTVQSMPTGVFTTLQMNGTDEVDDLGIHDPVTNNTRLTIGLALGWWLLTGKFVTAGSAVASSRRARWVLNGATGVNGGYGATPTMTATSMSGGFWTMETTTLVQATAAGDYVELQGNQDTGGAINTVVSGDLRCQMVALFQGA